MTTSSRRKWAIQQNSVFFYTDIDSSKRYIYIKQFHNSRWCPSQVAKVDVGSCFQWIRFVSTKSWIVKSLKWFSDWLLFLKWLDFRWAIGWRPTNQRGGRTMHEWNKFNWILINEDWLKNIKNTRKTDRCFTWFDDYIKLADYRSCVCVYVCELSECVSVYMWYHQWKR